MTSLKVNKEKLLIDSFSLFPFLSVSMLLESWEESRLHCINKYNDDCSIIGQAKD